MNFKKRRTIRRAMVRKKGCFPKSRTADRRKRKTRKRLSIKRFRVCLGMPNNTDLDTNPPGGEILSQGGEKTAEGVKQTSEGVKIRPQGG